MTATATPTRAADLAETLDRVADSRRREAARATAAHRATNRADALTADAREARRAADLAETDLAAARATLAADTRDAVEVLTCYAGAYRLAVEALDAAEKASHAATAAADLLGYSARTLADLADPDAAKLDALTGDPAPARRAYWAAVDARALAGSTLEAAFGDLLAAVGLDAGAIAPDADAIAALPLLGGDGEGGDRNAYRLADALGRIMHPRPAGDTLDTPEGAILDALLGA